MQQQKQMAHLVTDGVFQLRVSTGVRTVGRLHPTLAAAREAAAAATCWQGSDCRNNART